MLIPALSTLLFLGMPAPLPGQSTVSMLRNPSPEERIMNRIEALVVLPRRASPLREYRRTYAWESGKAKVRGIFSRIDPAGRAWVGLDKLPLLFDGGCGVVTVVFDVKRDKIERVDCNGLA
jgi:hypothetical protein